ncbi:RNA polymerase sigma factor [Gaoshiqia sp. Z1-71]|uniref:RNA polymerase sigma factor n=1 Tax=Gaoshiqia hydrogeniformans TaxID=3290090 RepID=UPI003BF7F95D
MVKETNHESLLWKRIRSGDTRAFHELYLLYADILFSFGTIFTKDQELIKDCIHDLIFDLFRYRRNLADTDNVRNYLFKSLKRKIQTAANRKLDVVYLVKLPKDIDQETADDEADASDEEIRDLAKITRAIKQLPERQQEILNLRFQLDLSYSEIAQVLDISVESARTSVYRSIKTIREQFDIRSISLFLIFRKKGILY